MAFSKNEAGIFLEGRITASDAALISQHRQSRRVCMTGIKVQDLDFMSCLTKLQSLQLYRCEIPHDQLSRFENLEKLFINGTGIQALDFLPGLTSLESFSIGYAPRIENIPDLSACVRLRRLNFFNCKRLVDIGNLISVPNLEAFGVVATPQKPADLVFAMRRPNKKNMSGAFGSKKLDAEFHALLKVHDLAYG